VNSYLGGFIISKGNNCKLSPEEDSQRKLKTAIEKIILQLSYSQKLMYKMYPLLPL